VTMSRVGPVAPPRRPRIGPRKVPFFSYPHLFAPHEEELRDAVLGVLQRGAYILQADLSEFERRLASYTGAKYALGVANGTDSLHIILRAVGVGPGDEVIVPSHTYIASAAAIHFSGATPLLVECGADHLIDAESVARAITPRTKAVMPVHLNGRTCDMSAIGAIAQKHGLHVVEDAAQAIGSKFRGRQAGTFGAAGSFSFYPAKTLGCFGDGGGLITNDADVHRKMALLRDHGRDPDGLVVAWGLNSRLDNVQAAVLNVKLNYLDAAIARRRTIAGRYRAGLEEVSEMVLPPGPDGDPDHFDTYQNYEVEAERRDELRTFLEERGVRTIIQWAGKAVHQFRGLGFDGVRLPKTERLFTRCFLLPMNTSLSDEDVDYICQVIREFYGRD